MSKWIKKDDKIVVITGNDKGRVGTVLSRKDDRVVIQGVNIRKKHAKQKTKVGTPEIMEIEKAIHISNVSLCDADAKPFRVKVRVNTEGNKELFYVSQGKEVIHRQLKTSKK